jgi:hypothetical protein
MPTWSSSALSRLALPFGRASPGRGGGVTAELRYCVVLCSVRHAAKNADSFTPVRASQPHPNRGAGDHEASLSAVSVNNWQLSKPRTAHRRARFGSYPATGMLDASTSMEEKRCNKPMPGFFPFLLRTACHHGRIVPVSVGMQARERGLGQCIPGSS